MFVLEYKRTAFERQIAEAVVIQNEAEKTELLNSKSEYNSSCLPRLVTRIGDKEWEKALEKEKKAEEIVEMKIRELRKKNNKARLTTEKEKPNKRQKTSENTYINIRETWGPPPPSAPIKNKCVEEENYDQKSYKKQKMEIKLTNLRTINSIIEGETITDFEILETDWEKHLKDHYDRLEKETEKREKQIKKQKLKEASWALYRECKTFLEENETEWRKRKLERDAENKKKERLQEANAKQEKLRNRIKERTLKEEIEKGLKNLPEKERKRIEKEEEKERKIDIANTKKTLWKLRTKEKNLVRTSEQEKTIENLENLQEKLTTIEELLKNIDEEKKKVAEETKKEKEKIEKEWREKVRKKYEKEAEKNEKLRKASELSGKWALLKWVTNYINNNQEKWEKEKEEKEKTAKKELEEWKKMKRLEKIKHLKKKWQALTSSAIETVTEKNTVETLDTWQVWRKKEKKETQENCFNTTANNLEDQVSETTRYDGTKILKKAKLQYNERENSGIPSTTQTPPKIQIKPTFSPQKIPKIPENFSKIPVNNPSSKIPRGTPDNNSPIEGTTAQKPEHQGYRQTGCSTSLKTNLSTNNKITNYFKIEDNLEHPNNINTKLQKPEHQGYCQDNKITSFQNMQAAQGYHKTEKITSQMKNNEITEDNNKTDDSKKHEDNPKSKDNNKITINEKPRTIKILRPPTITDNPITERKRRITNKQTKTEITPIRKTNKQTKTEITPIRKITQMLKPKSTLPNITITGNKKENNMNVICDNMSKPGGSQVDPDTNCTLSHSAINFSQNNDDPDLEVIKVEKSSLSKQLGEGLGDQINPQIIQKNMHHVQ